MIRWLRITFLPFSVVTLVSAALIVPLSSYVERPGQVLSLDACVTVGEARSAVPGDFLVTTVNVRQATLADYARAAVRSDTTIEQRGAIVPHGTDSGTYFRQQRARFRASADIAAAIGLKAAGLPATISGRGAFVRAVDAGLPASGLLFPGDVIVAVDGEPVTNARELRAAILDATEDEPLRLDVRRERRELTIDVVPTIYEDRLVIGIRPETFDLRVDLPTDVEVRSGPIGGPSAGLMMALTVYDKAAEDVDLAAGRIVAGTGEIDELGQVGPVGGVEFKVLAAQRAGATVFLAPSRDAAAAEAGLPKDSPLQVLSVDTFEEARQALINTAPEAPAKREGEDACPYDAPA
jgi:PDZ domain-containing protein